MRYSLLIVDDDEGHRFLMKRLIAQTQLDVRIYEKENGHEALEFFQAYEANRDLYHDDYPPLLCFLDINMPLMNGWDFLSNFVALRDKQDLKSMAILIFSSSSDGVDQNRAGEFDFVDGYILKGDITSEELKETIVSYSLRDTKDVSL